MRHTGADTLSEAIGTLERRGRACSILIVVAGAISPLALTLLSGSIETVLLAAAIGVPICLLIAWSPWSGSKEIAKAGRVLTSIDRFEVSTVAGFYRLRLGGSLSTGDAGHRPVAVRFSTTIASEDGGAPAAFHLGIPWDLPIDVAVFDNRWGSDVSTVADLLDRVRALLGPGEYLVTDTTKRRLESTVVPMWGRLRKPDESPESVRARLLTRWHDLDSLVGVASDDHRLNPEWYPKKPPPGSIGPFVLRAWCSDCGRSGRFRDPEGENPCPRCGGRRFTVLHRLHVGERGLARKMHAIRQQYVM